MESRNHSGRRQTEQMETVHKKRDENGQLKIEKNEDKTDKSNWLLVPANHVGRIRRKHSTRSSDTKKKLNKTCYPVPRKAGESNRLILYQEVTSCVTHSVSSPAQSNWQTTVTRFPEGCTCQGKQLCLHRDFLSISCLSPLHTFASSKPLKILSLN